MNKKGFTLVELLAVIAILALLVLLALPNILDLFNDAKKNSFETEVKSYYKEAQEEYVSDNIKEFSNVVSGKQKLEMSGNTSNDYYIELDSDGNITTFNITNGKYKIAVTNSSGVTKSDLNNAEEGSFTMNSDGTISGGSSSSSVPDPIAFSTDSWATIAKAVKNGTVSTIYEVGDTKQVTIAAHTNDCLTYDGYGSSYVCNSSNVSEQTFTVRIANMSTPSSCSTTGFSQTACGFVIEFTSIIDQHNYNSEDATNTLGTNVGGYPASEIREYLNTTLYNALPSDLKSVIIGTYTASGHGGISGETNFISTEKLYLLSGKEVHNSSWVDTTASLSRQLDYYSGKSVTSSSYADAIKKYNGSADAWWLRPAHSSYTNTFLIATESGHLFDAMVSSTLGVSPAFRIG